MKRAALLAAGVAVLVAIGLIWRSGCGASGELEHAAARAESEARAPSSSLADVDEDAETRSALEATITADEQARAATTAKSLGFELIVVDAVSQSPAPDAEVFVTEAPEPPLDVMAALWLRFGELLSSLESHGRRYRSDERGRVRLPPIKQRTNVLARLDGRRGIVEVLDWTKGPILLELHSDFDITVQVVDPIGLPLVGVPVTLTLGNEWSVREGEVAITSGPQALATLHHVGLALAINDGESGFAALAGLFDPPVSVALDPLHPPLEPVKLVAPASGELEVVLRHADGQLDAESAWVRVEIMRRSPAVLEEPVSAPWIGMLNGGRAVLPRVMLGCRFQGTVYRTGSDVRARAEIDGPTLPGERVTLTVDPVAGVEGPVVVFRVLDPHRQPLASKSVVISLTVGEKNPHGFRSMTTDGSGRLRVRVPNAFTDRQPTDLLVAQEDPTRQARYVAYAKSPLPADIMPDVTVLGDIHLTSGALVVGGRVLDEQGAPVSSARVWINSDGVWSGFWPSALGARTDASGRYEVRGICAAERLFAYAQVEGAKSPRVEFQLGDDGLDLVVARTGAIAGVVRMPSRLKLDELRIRANREDRDEFAAYEPGSDFDGTVYMRQLSPGIYRATIHLERENTEVLSLAGLRVNGGETLRPPELDPLDLTARIHLHELRARDFDGRLITGLQVTWRAAGRPPSADDPHAYFQNGNARIVSVHGQIDVDVAASGMRMVRVENLAGAREIVLARAVRVKLVLESGVALPNAPFRLGSILAPTPASVGRDDWGGSVFSSSRESFVDARESGPREVRYVVFRGDEGRSDAVIRPAVPQIVMIADEPGEQTFTVSITEAELRRAIDAYR